VRTDSGTTEAVGEPDVVFWNLGVGPSDAKLGWLSDRPSSLAILAKVSKTDRRRLSSTAWSVTSSRGGRVQACSRSGNLGA